MSWVAPFLVILRVLRSRGQSCVGSSGKQRTETSWALRSQGASQRCSGWPGLRSLVAVTPDHVISLSAHLLAPGLRGWQARCHPAETWLVSDLNAEAPIPAPSPPAARLGHGLRSQRPPRSLPGCCAAPLLAPCSPSPPRTHAALPASPSLVLPVSLTPPDAELSITPSQGPHGDARCRKITVASPCHPRVAVPRGNGAHGGAPQPPCCRNLWSSHLCCHSLW